MPTPPVLEVSDLHISYTPRLRLPWAARQSELRAVDGVSFTVGKDHGFGIVGESGCGKTTVSKAILQLVTPTAGQITVEGRPLATLRRNERRWYRRKVQAVFQNPYSSLSPRMRVGSIIAEPLQLQQYGNRQEVARRVAEVLELVGLAPGVASFFPHEFSGGQRQRIAIARALALQPDLVLFDEPLSALDVSIRAQTMRLILDLRREFRFSYIFIAHDLSTVRFMTETVAVMYLGKFVEVGATRSVFAHPKHPYTQALIAAQLRPDPAVRDQPVPVAGELPSPFAPPSGCRFHPRCPLVMEVCRSVEPALQTIDGREVACHLY